MGLTGLLLGAGASYDIGMPLALELTKELKKWLTPAKLRWLNDVWQGQGAGYSEATVDDLASVLASTKRASDSHLLISSNPLTRPRMDLGSRR